MLEVGRLNHLKIVARDESGAWLAAGDLKLLLPDREVPEGAGLGAVLQVFVWSDGRELHATIRRPFAQVGEFALMQVSEIGPHGAFMEWGLDKQLLVPFREQPEPFQLGRRYLVRVRLDREGRAVGSGRIDKFLGSEVEGLQAGDPVDLLLWQFTDLGAKVIVNQRWPGLLYRDEVAGKMRPGDRLQGYLKVLREDGKLDVTLRKIGSAGIDQAKQAILDRLAESKFLSLTDDSPPEQVMRMLGVSKKQFKKALGGLYKAGQVTLERDGVRALPSAPPQAPGAPRPAPSRPGRSAAGTGRKTDAARGKPEPPRDKRTRRRNKRNGPRRKNSS